MAHDPASSRTHIPGHQTVRSVVKAVQLLLRVASTPGQTAAQIATAEAIPLPTAYNLVNTLLAEGLLTRDSARRYFLGPKVAALSVAYAKAGPSEQVLAALRRLADSTGETVYLSAWRDGSVVALASIEGASAVHVGRIHTELRGHEHARASGKLLLAHLDKVDLDRYLGSRELDAVTPWTITDRAALIRELAEIQARGVAFDEAEFNEGVGCVAAPVYESGICVASVTITAPLERMRHEREHLVAAALESAKQLSHSNG